MTEEAQMTVQAFLDRELPPEEHEAVAARLPSDPAARSLLNELEMARNVLADGELTRGVPESREFYWSKIEREIGRQEAAANRDAPRDRTPWWRWVMIPAAGLAVLALLLSVAGLRLGGARDAYLLEASTSDSGAFTYRDDQEGVTLVWLSYPSDAGRAGAKAAGDTP